MTGVVGAGSRESDIHILTILDLKDHEGLTSQQIADRLGVTRNSVIGAVSRLKPHYDPKAVCEGTMPRRWWA